MSEGADQFFGKNALFRCEYLDPGTVKKLKGLRRFFDLPQQFEGYQILHLFPFSTLASTFGYSYALQTFLPSDQPHRTHFTSRLMTSRLKDGMKPEVLASFFDSTAQMNKTVFDEDHAICQRVSPRALSPDFGPLLGLHEAKVSHFRQALKEALQHP
jgi:phenylpropionate dioxygenase-like ring-hydroxylating dioxygenase large terminal subunit